MSAHHTHVKLLCISLVRFGDSVAATSTLSRSPAKEDGSLRRSLRHHKLDREDVYDMSLFLHRVQLPAEVQEIRSLPISASELGRMLPWRTLSNVDPFLNMSFHDRITPCFHGIPGSDVAVYRYSCAAQACVHRYPIRQSPEGFNHCRDFPSEPRCTGHSCIQ